MVLWLKGKNGRFLFCHSRMLPLCRRSAGKGQPVFAGMLQGFHAPADSSIGKGGLAPLCTSSFSLFNPLVQSCASSFLLFNLLVQPCTSSFSLSKLLAPLRAGSFSLFNLLVQPCTSSFLPSNLLAMLRASGFLLSNLLAPSSIASL